MKYLEERIVKLLMLGSIGIVGFFVFGESMSLLAMVGIVLVFGAVVLLNVKSKDGES